MKIIKQNDSIPLLTNKVHELDKRVNEYIETLLKAYLLLASPPLKGEITKNKIKWRGIKLIRQGDSFLGGLHYSLWLEQRGFLIGKIIRVDYKDTGTAYININ